MSPGKIFEVNITIFFVHHDIEDGLNFLQANFGVNKIVKIMMEVGVQYSLPLANLFFNLKNPNRLISI